MPDEADLDTILAEPSPHRLFKQIRERIFALKGKGPFASYRQQLTVGELMVLLVNGFIWEMDNGGMNQIMFNSIGDDAESLRGQLRIRGRVHPGEPGPVRVGRRWEAATAR